MADTLSDILEYKNGDLFWKKKISKKTVIGRKAGTVMSHGYICLQIHGKRILAHRIIWELFNGKIPENLMLDHINGNPSDNRIENLRLANEFQNSMNQRKRRSGSSVYKGVSFYKRTSKYLSQIGYNGGHKHLGFFSSEKEAALAYNVAALRHHGEFAVLNEVDCG